MANISVAKTGKKYRNKIKLSKGEWAFEIFNYTFLTILALSCVLPFIHLLAVSFSSSAAAIQGRVGFWPVEFTLASYEFAIQGTGMIRALVVTIQRLGLGIPINMILVILAAYPLSKTDAELPGRTVIAWVFVVTMLIGAGLIPTFLVVSATGLRNTLWALVLPGAVSAFHITLLLNVFRQLPKELEESALMDGASQLRILFQIYIPLSMATLAALTLFNAVGHWNDWFSGMIYMDRRVDFPLQTYLRGMIIDRDFTLIDPDQIAMMMQINTRTFNAAQIMIATIPILCVYPFLQRYFVKGMTLGSLKG